MAFVQGAPELLAASEVLSGHHPYQAAEALGARDRRGRGSS